MLHAIYFETLSRVPGIAALPRPTFIELVSQLKPRYYVEGKSGARIYMFQINSCMYRRDAVTGKKRDGLSGFRCWPSYKYMHNVPPG